MKATALSWCAKAGLSKDVRLVFGHHTSGKKSAECYSRDLLAAPLRELESIITQVRTGALLPDSTRSGQIAEPTASDVRDTWDAAVLGEDGNPGKDANLPAIDLEPADSSSSAGATSEASESTDEEQQSREAFVQDQDPLMSRRSASKAFVMYQHVRTKVVHVKPRSSAVEATSCGMQLSPDLREIGSSRFLDIRLCKRCETSRCVTAAMANTFAK